MRPFPEIRVKSPYFPCQLGRRFSKKAPMPSSASALSQRVTSAEIVASMTESSIRGPNARAKALASATAPGAHSRYGATSASIAASSESAEDRLAMLKEVRMHLDLLNDFVGIIPQEHLNKRKRKLYQALPLAPPSLAQRSTARRAASGN